MIKVVCFDFDGVICKGELCSIRLERDYGVAHKDFVKILDSSWKEARIGKLTIEEVWEKPLKKWKLPFTLEQFFDYWFGYEQMDKEILNLIKNLRKKIKVFLLTNNSVGRMDFYNKRNKLFSNFDEVIMSGSIGALKTSKKAAIQICELANANPKEIAVIDNSQKDLDKYSNHGFRTILYTSTKKLKAQLKALGI